MALPILLTTDTPQQRLAIDTDIIRVVQGIFGVRPGNSVFTNYQTFEAEFGLTALADELVSASNDESVTQIATKLVANLAIKGEAATAAVEFAVTYLGEDSANWGRAIIDIVKVYPVALADDAVFGKFVTEFNKTVSNSLAYSSNPANTDEGQETTLDILSAIDEGATVHFSLNDVNGAEGDVINYTLSGVGVDAADIVDADLDGDADALTGSVTLDANQGAHVAIEIAADATTEGAEILSLNVADSDVSASVLINDTSIESLISTLDINAEGTSDAALADTIFAIAAGEYTHTITGFAAGDQLQFAAGSALSLKNTSDTDGNQTITALLNGDVTTVQLTGLQTPEGDQAFGVSSFNTFYGADSIVIA